MPYCSGTEYLYDHLTRAEISFQAIPSFFRTQPRPLLRYHHPHLLHPVFISGTFVVLLLLRLISTLQPLPQH